MRVVEGKVLQEDVPYHMHHMKDQTLFQGLPQHIQTLAAKGTFIMEGPNDELSDLNWDKIAHTNTQNWIRNTE